MKFIKGSTKKGQVLLEKAEYNEGTELWQVYGRCSVQKEVAMENCRRRYAEDDGYDFRIISHNTFQFSVAWNYINRETGEEMTRIETAGNTYIIDGSRREVI